MGSPQNNFRMFPDKFSSVVSNNAEVFFPLYPTLEQFFPLYPAAQKNLMQCIPQRRRFCPFWDTAQKNDTKINNIVSNFKYLSLT